ncbi:MAG: enoyl-CoA hydratase/isomerase family protein, partial [Porticoccaceae bacterium]|nr:enoyl-CoA hydratase/isomerase family protein [Porticoccaceae bacterium]
MTDRVDFDVEQGIAVITVNNPPVNALSHAVREGIYDGVRKALDDDSVIGVVIFCEGRTFIAGADISEFGSAPKEPHLPAVLSLLDESTKPIVAAVHGTALGGGLETTLCCNYRVAVSGAK